MDWLGDAWNSISGLWDNSWVDQATDWMGDRPKDSFWGGVFSGQSLLGGVKGLYDYYNKPEAPEAAYSQSQEYLDQVLGIKRDEMAQAAEMAAAESAAAKEIAAMQLEFQKQLAQYQARVQAQGFRADTTRQGHGQTANALTALASIAQRPFV